MKTYRLLCLTFGTLLLAACAGPQKPAPVAVDGTGKGKLPPTEIVKDGGLLKLGYEGFTVWLDCKERAAVKFRYNAQRDQGNFDRSESFSYDPYVPRECQQTSTSGYGNNYDRGHQVPANHLDYSPVAIKQSNYMTNILPQAANMNRGAWLRSEEIVECYRDIDELLVLGGVIWGTMRRMITS